MMEALREWLWSIVAVTVVLSVVQQLAGEGAMGKIVSFLGGLLLLTVLLGPLPGIDPANIGREMENYTRELQKERKEQETAGQAELAALIESRTAAYISEQAKRLGTEVTAVVNTVTGEEGIPVPAAAELRGMPSAELEAWIERELGIPRERQVWNHEG